MNKKYCMLAASAIFLAGTLGSEDAQAASEKDTQVAARTFGFIDGVPADQLGVAIIHDENNPASKAGKHTLKSMLIDINNLSGLSGMSPM